MRFQDCAERAREAELGTDATVDMMTACHDATTSAGSGLGFSDGVLLVVIVLGFVAFHVWKTYEVDFEKKEIEEENVDASA